MTGESLNSAQAKLAEARAEAITNLTEYELLGLDKPTREQLISNRDEAAEVTKILYLLHKAGRNEGMMNAILARFNLNDGLFDETENPRGMFDSEAKDKPRLKILLISRLVGASPYIIRAFFAEKNSTKGLSSVALSTAEEAHMRRQRYPIEHLNEFPNIAALLERIQKYGGPDIHGIFHPDATIPPVGEWIKRQGAKSPITLEQVLTIVTDALSGEKTEADIARERKIPVSTVNVTIRRFKEDVKKGKNQVLSDELLTLIEQKVKMGKG